MKWRFLNTGLNSGKFNMAFDLFLAKICQPGEAYLRLYRWNPYCISLGANQTFESINSGKAVKDGLDIVKRPTGGRAILHSEEITYSVIMPVDSNSSVKKIYNDINLALKKGLKLFDKKLDGVELEGSQPDFQTFYKKEISAVCFAVPAKSELKYGDKKLAGSAQRKIGNTVLQHGSLMVGKFHKRISDYLMLSAQGLIEIRSEIENNTIELNSILNYGVDYGLLAEKLLNGFEEHFETIFEHVDIKYLQKDAEVSNIFI